MCLGAALALAGGQAAPAQTRPAAPARPATQARPAGQTAPGEKPLMVEDIMKNVQVLKNMPVDQFMATMGFMAASLSLNCLDCHVDEAASDFSKYAVDTPIKIKAREMVVIMNNINKGQFGGQRAVTCYTCHRADVSPRVTPSLAEQYGMPPSPDPNDIEIGGVPAPGAPTADQLLDRYIADIGGADKWATVTTLVGTGTYGGYDTDFLPVPAEVYSKAPNEQTTVVHPPSGVSTTALDGRLGWIAATATQIPLSPLTGPLLDGLKLDAEMAFPAGIKKYLTRWRVGFPPTAIGDTSVDVAEGRTPAPGNMRVKFFFDKRTGMLMRYTRFQNTAIGLNPLQVDYSDYRDVAGVKVPFKYTVSWTDGRSEFVMNDIRANVPIDAAKFGKPAVAKAN